MVGTWAPPPSVRGRGNRGQAEALPNSQLAKHGAMALTKARKLQRRTGHVAALDDRDHVVDGIPGRRVLRFADGGEFCSAAAQNGSELLLRSGTGNVYMLLGDSRRGDSLRVDSLRDDSLSFICFIFSVFPTIILFSMIIYSAPA